MKKCLAITAIASACLLAAQASAQVSTSPDGQLTGAIAHHIGTIDYANAKPMPLPQSTKAPPSLIEGLIAAEAAGELPGKPGATAGAVGTGKLSPMQLFTPKADDFDQRGFGTANQVFTTARVDASGDQTSKFYPYRAAGKLFFKDNSNNSLVCSASLVSKGLVVTAAHCVMLFGAKKFYTGHQFVPAYNNGSAPYGTWTAARLWVKTSYFNGTDSCTTAGVVCTNDVAIIVLNSQSGVYAGTNVGWLGTGWNGLGFNSSNQALINQLGYPVALDAGKLMLRNDSQGFTDSKQVNNTVIGSQMTGGSSGGPWVVNLGITPALGCDSKGCTIAPTQGQSNRVVGVTSWGFNPTSPPTPKTFKVMQQGASRFTNTNICSLMNSACFDPTKGIPAACAFASLAC